MPLEWAFLKEGFYRKKGCALYSELNLAVFTYE